MGSDFPTNSVMNSYISTENTLAEVLRIVPYCKEHENFRSPALIPVILDSCSQLGSLWQYQAKQSPCVEKNKELTITDYFTYFGKNVSPKWVIFWAERPQLLYPYGKWANANKYALNDYKKLDWWDAYTKLKHDRLLNRHKATLQYAVQSLAGLFLAILTCEPCCDGVVQEDWVSANHPNLQACLNDNSPSAYLHYCVAESKLFAHPVGWDKQSITLDCSWTGPASNRFINWFDQYSTEK